MNHVEIVYYQWIKEHIDTELNPVKVNIYDKIRDDNKKLKSISEI